MDLHQILMDKIYRDWEEAENINYNQLISTLDQKHRLAFLTGNLDAQVLNGGFSQWHSNDYSSEAQQLVTLLSFYKDETVKEVIGLVQQAIGIINKYQGDIDEAVREDDEDEAVMLEKEMNFELDKLDDRYYEINDKFLVAIENILNKLNDMEVI